MGSLRVCQYCGASVLFGLCAVNACAERQAMTLVLAGWRAGRDAAAAQAEQSYSVSAGRKLRDVPEPSAEACVALLKTLEGP